MEHETFICECNSVEHIAIFSFDKDWDDIFMHVHLTKKGFWTRLKYAIRYIFGYQCQYGAFDEFIFNPNDADKLQKVVDVLKEIKKKNG